MNNGVKSIFRFVINKAQVVNIFHMFQNKFKLNIIRENIF